MTAKIFLCFVICIAAVRGLTVVPEQIPFSDPEITNANRGFYTWYSNNVMPLPQAPYFEYSRFSWNTIEKGLDQYDFSSFDYQAQKCCSRPGCSFGFRFMATQPEYITVLPTYLTSAMDKAYFINNTYAKAIVPDWNDPYFLERSRALLNATSKHIRESNFTCVRHVDIGIYGWWGEGHLSAVTYPLPNGAQEATNATQYAIVDMHLEAFKDMQLYAMSDNAIMTLHAFSKSATVGLRRDSLGNPVFDYLKTKASWGEVQNRWKQAPFITEPFGGYPTSTNTSEVLRQVKEFHVTLVANGGLGLAKIDDTTMRPLDQQNWMDAGKSAGFRLTIERIEIAEPVGKNININVTWNNHGVAPMYEAWNVVLSLLSNGSVVGQATSGVDIRTVMPESPVSFAEEFDISTLEKGEYTLAMQIVDPTNRNTPLALAIKGADDNNVYKVGTFQVDPSIVPTSAAKPTAVTPSSITSSGDKKTLSAVVSLSLIVLSLCW